MYCTRAGDAIELHDAYCFKLARFSRPVGLVCGHDLDTLAGTQTLSAVVRQRGRQWARVLALPRGRVLLPAVLGTDGTTPRR